MSLDAWLTLLVVAGTLVLLATERLRPAVVVLGATCTLLVLGVIDVGQAFAGFSNAAPITVAALYVVAGAVERTGALEPVTRLLLDPRAPTSERPRRAHPAPVPPPGAGASASRYNTPVVAMVAPRLSGWARRTGRSASHFLMPLSFATILGGVVTTIGTSTNLLVNGLMIESGVRPIGLFELSKAGLPVAATGLLVLVVVGRLLLVNRKASGAGPDVGVRQFTVEMLVRVGSPLIGRSIGDAGLRNLQGVYLVEVHRGDQVIAPVAPQETLGESDRLVFIGDVRRVLDLQRIPGLEPAESHHFDVTGNGTRRFFEAVVAPGGDLAGHTLKSIGFRSRHRAAVVAIHRAGERLDRKLGQVQLRPGDVLLILSDPDFARRWRSSEDFLLVSSLNGEIPVRHDGARVTQILVVALVALAGTGALDILSASLLAVGGLLVARVISIADARESVNDGIVLLIAASFGLGAALTETGLAARLAAALSNITSPLGEIGLLTGLVLATTALTALINNNASAVLMWPIALATALQYDLDPRPLGVAIMLAASMDFLTPFGYQTNTMVYGMGGYRLGDFARLGLPITITTVVTLIVAIPLAWPLSSTQ